MEDPRYHSVFTLSPYLHLHLQDSTCKGNLLAWPDLSSTNVSKMLLRRSCSVKKPGSWDQTRPGQSVVLRGLSLLHNTDRPVRGPYSSGLNCSSDNCSSLQIHFPTPCLSKLLSVLLPKPTFSNTGQMVSLSSPKIFTGLPLSIEEGLVSSARFLRPSMI